MEQDQPNWNLIEADFCAGILSVAAICAKHGISRRVLETTSQIHGWKRNPPDLQDIMSYAAGGGLPVESPDGFAPRMPIDSAFTDHDLRRIALEQASAILNHHRRDLARLRTQAATISERLEMLLGGVVVERPFMSSRETPADLLEKLSRVMLRVIGLERQAYGLDVLLDPMQSQDNDDSSDAMGDDRMRRIEELAGRLGYRRVDEQS